MNNSTIIFLINDDCRAIKGVYEPNGPEETFKTFDPDIAVDDLIVVESNTRHEVTTVKVTAVDVDLDFNTSQKVKWVVDRIDMFSFEQLLELEQEAIRTVQMAEKRRVKEELRKSLMANHEAEFAKLAITNISDDPVTE